MFRAALTIVGGMCFAYFLWLIRPPADPVGTALSDWDTPDRQRKLIRDEDEQERRLGFLPENER